MNPAVTTTAPIQPWPGSQDDLPDGTTAMFFAAQTDHIVPPRTVRDAYATVTGPAGYVELAEGTNLSGAGGFRGAVTAWFRWQLMGDPIARSQFVGPDPTIAANPRFSAYETNARLMGPTTRWPPSRHRGEVLGEGGATGTRLDASWNRSPTQWCSPS